MDKFIGIVIFVIAILLILCFYEFILDIYRNNNRGVQEINDQMKVIKSKAPLIISLTTSPTRLNFCLENLDNMILDDCIPKDAEIHLNLPRTFRRTGEKYPDNIAHNQRIQIYRDFEDEGPATKLLPTLDRIRDKYVEGLVITIDDDIYYKREVFELHLYFAQLYNYKTATCFRDLNDPLDITNHFDKYRTGLKSMLFPRMATMELSSAPLPHHLTYFIEGFGSVGYPISYMNPDKVREYISMNKACRNSDDLLLSMSLHDLGIPIIKIAVNELYHLYNLIRVLDFGLQEDALHNVQSHHEKYYNCALDLLKI